MLNILISPGEGVRLQTRGNFLDCYYKCIGVASQVVSPPFIFTVVLNNGNSGLATTALKTLREI